ncbi:MAG: hypothetical protein II688_01945, partial [Lachnospiraceae bacterium]|nr:hypothetical protein [Lachnospiraceae bacterium]
MNKLGTKLGAIAMSAIMAVSFAPSAVITTLAASDDTTATGDLAVPVYCWYNPNSGEHYFTVNETEGIGLAVAGWEEGNVKWYAPTSGTPVYGLYNPNVVAPDGTPLGDHHYTSDAAEKDRLLKAGWKEGDVKFYSAEKDDLLRDEVYCLYNPNAYVTPNYSGAHHLTLDKDEYDAAVAAGWSGEGVKFYGYAEEPSHEDFTVTIDNTTPKVDDTLTATVEGMAAASY